jgi:hypothetical protein
MRNYRKRKAQENKTPQASMSTDPTQTYLLNTCVIIENGKLRKIKHHKHLRQLTLHQLQLYTIIIKPMNTGWLVIFLAD